MKVSEIVQQIVAPGGGYCNGDPLPDDIAWTELVTLIAAMENKVDVWGELAIEWEEAVQACDQEGYPVPAGETLAGHIQSKLSRLRDFEAKAEPAPAQIRPPRPPRVKGYLLDSCNWFFPLEWVDLMARLDTVGEATPYLALNGVTENRNLILTEHPDTERLRIAPPDHEGSWIEVPLPAFHLLLKVARTVYGDDYDIGRLVVDSRPQTGNEDEE